MTVWWSACEHAPQNGYIHLEATDGLLMFRNDNGEDNHDDDNDIYDNNNRDNNDNPIAAIYQIPTRNHWLVKDLFILGPCHGGIF